MSDDSDKETCECKDPWKSHPEGFIWDSSDKEATPRHLVRTRTMLEIGDDTTKT